MPFPPLTSVLRRAILPLFSRLNPGDIRIRHHWTGDPVYLHSFRHRGYWFHGRNRELSTMRLISRLLRAGDTVLDVGGHIGYTALYFAWLVGAHGRVLVFEPAPENLRYLRRNSKSIPTIQIIAEGAGACEATGILYVEQLSGQNSSFVPEFEGFSLNRQSASCLQFKSREVQVPITTLDRRVFESGVHPRFVKIDVEGFEYDVLKGMVEVLRVYHPLLMIEVQRRKQEVFDLLSTAGYLLFTPELTPVRDADELSMNAFCFHHIRHLSDMAAAGTPVRTIS